MVSVAVRLVCWVSLWPSDIQIQALLYAPCMTCLPEWFVQRRGLANGVIFAGTYYPSTENRLLILVHF